jgi:uncharacterized OsmC-like protein
MAIAARRHGVDLAGLRYEVTKEMSAEGPRRIRRLVVSIWLPEAARHAPPGVLEKAAHACPVHQSLSPEVEKVIEFHALA